MDLNFELMREQIALHRAQIANSPTRRLGHRDDARSIRGRIDQRFAKRSAYRPVSA
ncbi:MAG: hypothetical protein ABI412_06590 [Sphingomicrobium sp.]